MVTITGTPILSSPYSGTSTQDQTSSDASADTSTDTSSGTTTEASSTSNSSSPSATTNVATETSSVSAGQAPATAPSSLTTEEIERAEIARSREDAIEARNSMVRNMMLSRISEAASANASEALAPIAPNTDSARIATLYAPVSGAFAGDQSNAGSQKIDVNA